MLQQFKQYIQQQHLFTIKDKLLLAVSGGVDSVVLCHLCRQAGYEFSVAHCNFQLREVDSYRDEAFVVSYAKTLNVPVYTIRFDTKTYAADNKISIQEAARILRYNWFESIRQQQGLDYILTAHHADDNIETLLMNFFRGTGINGLTGIKPVNHRIRRPLLFAKRKDLEAYLLRHRLQFVQDRSNLQENYTRNYFRNTVLPLIAKSYPEVKDNLVGNLQRFSEIEILYRQQLLLLEKKIAIKKGNEITLPILLLKKTPAMATVLLELLKPYGFKPAQIPEIIRIMDSESGRLVRSTTHRIVKDRKHLIIAILPDHATSAIVIEGVGCYRFKQGQLLLKEATPGIIWSLDTVASINASAVQFPLILRPWRIGDYFYPLGMKKKKKVSRFLIDKKLSLTDKEKIWVLEMNKKIVWIVGHRLDERFKVAGTTHPVFTIEFKTDELCAI